MVPDKPDAQVLKLRVSSRRAKLDPYAEGVTPHSPGSAAVTPATLVPVAINHFLYPNGFHKRCPAISQLVQPL